MVHRKAQITVLGTVVFFALLTPFADAASLTISPKSGIFQVGNTFTVAISVSTPTQAMNAVSGQLTFSNDYLQVVSLSKDDSIVNLWVQEPSFSNFDGKINFEGVALNPGFTGNYGKIISVVFRARKVGTASISFNAGSVLANDGLGTNIVSLLDKVSYTINAATASGVATPSAISAISLPVVHSNTHIQENKWYNAENLSLTWDLPAGIDGVSYDLNLKSDFIPQSQSMGLLSGTQYDLQRYKDGAWFFHIKFHGSGGWGQTAHRSVKIDFTPPSPPNFERFADDDPTNPQPIFDWQSSDFVSGVDYFSAKIGGGDWFVTPSTGGHYVLPLQAPGEHALTIRAYDVAGNFSDTSTIFSVQPIAVPIITDYSAEINSPQQAFTAVGTSLPNAKVLLRLRSDTAFLNLYTNADGNGNWNLQYNNAMPSGRWELKAQAIDVRGAMSLETEPVIINVSGWLAKFLGMMGEWGVVAAVGVFLSAGIAVLLFFVTHQIKMFRSRLKKELWSFREELRQDLKNLEKDMDGAKKDGLVDLSPGNARKTKTRIVKDVGIIEEKIEEEMKKIDRLGK